MANEPVQGTGTVTNDTSDRLPRQYGALCYRLGAQGPEILLITSRRSGQWLAPKGGIVPGLTPVESAAREAWEEAGVRGVIGAEEAGRYVHVKSGRNRGGPYLVGLYPLEVTGEAADYPEAHQRRRAWFTPQEAAKAARNPELGQLLLDFAATYDHRPVD